MSLDTIAKIIIWGEWQYFFVLFRTACQTGNTNCRKTYGATAFCPLAPSAKPAGMQNPYLIFAKMYSLLRRFLFLFDAEKVHGFAMKSFSLCCRIPFLQRGLQRSFSAKDTNSPVSVFGLEFRNPVGLAAGFDKNAAYLRALETLGFGFVETGTLTPLPQAGNDKPRLFRLPKDKVLINRMGFNNDGASAAAARIKEYRSRYEGKMIIGGNIGKNKMTPNADAWKDYEKCFLTLYEVVDYFVVNVSSPNTPGLRELQKKEELKKILGRLQMLRENMQEHKPILLKIAPDLAQDDVDDIAALALEIPLDGLVCTNTTLSREGLHSSKEEIDMAGAGGLSGLPLKERSTALLKRIYHKTGGNIPIIASGGIFTADDAKEKITAGAGLVQVYTGFIYEGPGVVRKIMREWV